MVQVLYQMDSRRRGCALDGSAGTCTGSACAISGSSSDGKCKKEVDIDAHDKEDICIVANCTGHPRARTGGNHIHHIT